jgi:hypothetical protein
MTNDEREPEAQPNRRERSGVNDERQRSLREGWKQSAAHCEQPDGGDERRYLESFLAPARPKH